MMLNDLITILKYEYTVHPGEYEYCEQIEPPVRMIEPASAINRATQCNRESH